MRRRERRPRADWLRCSRMHEGLVGRRRGARRGHLSCATHLHFDDEIMRIFQSGTPDGQPASAGDWRPEAFGGAAGVEIAGDCVGQFALAGPLMSKNEKPGQTQFRFAEGIWVILRRQLQTSTERARQP
jgi:hypothetical protein